MMNDKRRWALEHEGRTPRTWHWYPDGDYEPAQCGRPPISGSPLVSCSPEWTEKGKIEICNRCYEQSKQMEIKCEICGEVIGHERDYDEIECPGERASESMRDYYERRWHYQSKHNMTDQEARPYAL